VWYFFVFRILFIYIIFFPNRTTISDRLSSFYGNIRSHLLGGVLAGRRSVYEVSDADIAEGEDGLTAFRQETEGKEGKKNVIHLKRSSSGRTERIHLDVSKLMDCASCWRYGMDAYISVQLIIFLFFMSLNAIILTLFIQFSILFFDFNLSCLSIPSFTG